MLSNILEIFFIPFKIKMDRWNCKCTKKDAVGGVKRILDNIKHRDNLLILISLVDPYMYTAKQLKDNDIITIITQLEEESAQKKKTSY